MNKIDFIQKFQILIACTIITTGIIISSCVFAQKISKNETITVTGSASKIVKSDTAKFTFYIQAKAPNQKEAYAIIKKQKPIVIDYLKSKGIDEKNINVKTINGYYAYKYNEKGYSTNEVLAYNANLEIDFNSKDVEKIKEISNDIQVLADKGIMLSLRQPEYFYSNLAELKIDLLKEATLDAKQRATSMLSATGANVGKVKQMKMGVFQITPPDSTDVSDYGMNDTSSIDKKITAVTNIVFNVK